MPGVPPFIKQVGKCPFTSVGFIAGGEAAHTSEFPHMAHIALENTGSPSDFVCGGSIISER